MSDDRIQHLRLAMADSNVDLVALAPSDNLRYELGFSPIADERACLLLVSEQGLAFVVPALNADQAAQAAPGLAAYSWKDAEGPHDAIRSGLAAFDGAAFRRVAVDPEMRADIFLELQSFVPNAEHVSAGELMGRLREVKSDDEINLLRASAHTADQAMQSALAACRAGATELEVAEAARAGFSEAGVDHVTFTIAASGPNGAFPHHHTGQRVLEVGDAVVIDIGASRAGYASDLTRMAFVGEPSERYREVHAIVEAAVQAAMAAARPGATPDQIDGAARGVIQERGYGENFVHRTGHGLGLSVHEPPWIMSGADEVLRKGTVFSIEPGIYLPGEFGVRLEEIVYLTDDGCERFSALPRDVYTSG
jgi:Xaa-Pro aminopeptidase